MHKKKIFFGLLILMLLVVAWFLLRDTDGSSPDRIYTNISIHGVAVGGLTVAEATALLMERFQPSLDERTLRYMAAGKMVAEFTFAEFGARFDFEPLVQDALDHGYFGGLDSRISRLLGRTYNIAHTPQITFVHEKAESIFSQLARQLNQELLNANFAMENGSITITPESPGRAIDMEAMRTATVQALNSLNSDTIDIAIHEVAPDYTYDDFDFELTAIGSFQTKYEGTEADPRVYNVGLASQKIHNQVVLPGEVFSAGATVGANRPNSGYKSAIVLVRGEPVEDIGGGVCQVVTTLYNAALAAELAIVQRHNHSAIVSYVSGGFDATIAGDYLDLKFANNTAHPILISSQMADGNLRIVIYGFESRPPERSIHFTATRTAIIKPEAYREVVCNTVPRGERQITLPSQMGYHYELHKHIYVNGEEVDVVKINSSEYKPLQGVIAIGAG